MARCGHTTCSPPLHTLFISPPIRDAKTMSVFLVAMAGGLCELGPAEHSIVVPAHIVYCISTIVYHVLSHKRDHIYSSRHVHATYVTYIYLRTLITTPIDHTLCSSATAGVTVSVPLYLSRPWASGPRRLRQLALPPTCGTWRGHHHTIHAPQRNPAPPAQV